MPTLILTLELDPAAQDLFERMRRQHYPPALNQIPAHLTLFHQLPPVALDAVRRAAQQPPFSLQVTGLRSLGRGAAYTLASARLFELHADLAQTFAEVLIPQDRQRFAPHIVIQNKATSEAARELLATLQPNFQPFEVQALALVLWEYLGGPWKLRRRFTFLQD